MHAHPDGLSNDTCLFFRDCMKVGEVDGKKIGCTVSLLVSSRSVCFWKTFNFLLDL